MKNLVVTFFLLFLGQQIIACSCELPPSLCTFTKSLAGLETELIFSGEYLRKDSIDDFSAAYEFKVLEIFRGNIILPDSPLANDSTYENTDSTVWMIGGLSELCLRYLENPKALFVLNYTPSYFGYYPHVCYNNYFPIDEEGNISGWIWSNTKIDTLALSELPSLLNATCTTSTIESDSINLDLVKLSPNPFTDVVQVEWPYKQIELSAIELVDHQGSVIKKFTRLENSQQLNLSDFQSGLYFVRFQSLNHVCTKKLIKF